MHPALSDRGPGGAEEALSNALFLLQFAFLDVNADNKTGAGAGSGSGSGSGSGGDSEGMGSLVGLCLLPMEDGALGVIGSPAEAPIYLVEAAERKLLQQVRSRTPHPLVHASSILINF